MYKKIETPALASQPLCCSLEPRSLRGSYPLSQALSNARALSGSLKRAHSLRLSETQSLSDSLKLLSLPKFSVTVFISFVIIVRRTKSLKSTFEWECYDYFYGMGGIGIRHICQVDEVMITIPLSRANPVGTQTEQGRSMGNSFLRGELLHSNKDSEGLCSEKEISAMEAYKQWVRKNRAYVHSLESLANGMTWLLPERFAASEIGPEAVTTILGIITAINQHIIDTAPTRMSTGPTDPSSSLSLSISIIKDLEMLVEVVAQHFYGDDKKWSFLAFTEATKVLVRLALFRDSGYKMLLRGGEDVNVEKDHNSVDQGVGDFARAVGYQGAGPSYNAYGPRGLEGRAMFALSQFGENAKMVSSPSWMNRLQHHEAIIMKNNVIQKPTISSLLSEKGLFGGLFLASEVLFILRPLIYVLFIRRYGVRSWFPWSVSLAVDLVGMGILSRVTNPCRGTGKNTISLSIMEKDEVKRRKIVWALYLMRDPFFSKYTRHRLESVEKLVSPVPLIGFLTAKLVELTVGAQTRYTYTSAS
ncbi:hypothetical protein H6P81_015097 [Aristolochia fimbriata]|uniref:Peroxisomal membrane protein PEX16 n=1 Tax=Aristolochia fimbriata TaxID=158543 RepID=A0AAV7E8C7_ARIFI|nr:hypothetical protein H6P81_015097 [Aristolochia fimbriata]